MESTVYINTLTKTAHHGITGHALPKVLARLQAHLQVDVRFFETDKIAELLEGTPTFRIGLKESPEGVAFIYAAAITQELADGYRFTFESVDSSALRTFLGDCKEAKDAFLEIEWNLDDIVERVAIPAKIENAYLRTDEELPDPMERAARWYPAITGLTGGGATNLDGILTAGRSHTLVHLYVATELQDWLLFTGTDAEDGTGIIRPDDYHATTNAQVWKRLR